MCFFCVVDDNFSLVFVENRFRNRENSDDDDDDDDDDDNVSSRWIVRIGDAHMHPNTLCSTLR